MDDGHFLGKYLNFQSNTPRPLCLFFQPVFLSNAERDRGFLTRVIEMPGKDPRQVLRQPAV